MLGFVILFLLTSCSSDHAQTHPWQNIAGRDRAVKEPIYHARVSPNWIRIDPDPNEPLEDTMKPVCRFEMMEGDTKIDITVHTFPTDTIDQRIPPEAQVARWQRQNPHISTLHQTVRPVAHGGFVGLCMETDGLYACSLQLGPEHYHKLSPTPDTPRHRQMRADYTIKAMGPSELMAQHQQAIEAFARSFELIEEIPLTR